VPPSTPPWVRTIPFSGIGWSVIAAPGHVLVAAGPGELVVIRPHLPNSTPRVNVFEIGDFAYDV
jgi:hypothetical protein